MSFIGCDVVDKSSWFQKPDDRRKKYFDKAFTSDEQSLMTQPFYALLFWAAKECAYKILFKKGRHKAFSPGLYECISIVKDTDIQSFDYAITVKYSLDTVKVRAGVFQEAVCAYGVDDELINKQILMHYRLEDHPEDPGKVGRRMLHTLIDQEAAHRHQHYFTDHSVYKYPVLQENKAPFLEDISMSHDGLCFFVAALKKEIV